MPGWEGQPLHHFPDKAPETPETAESLLPPWPSLKVSFPRSEKGDNKESENAEASGPRVASEAPSASPGSIQQPRQSPGALPSLCACPAAGATLISMARVLHSNTLV